MSKIITIFGVTGVQGGSVVRAIQAHPALSKAYKIRGVVRDHTKPAAEELKRQGVELVSADLNDKSSLSNALKGSDSVFLVTNFWEAKDADIEEKQGSNVADVVAELGIPQLIFSSLINVTQATGGKLKHVTHFDSKARVEQYIKGNGIKYTAFVLPGYYMSNLKSMLQKGDGGSYTWALPVSSEAKFPLIDTAADLGKFAIPALQDPAANNGKQFYAAQDYYPLKTLTADFERGTGKKLNVKQVPHDVYKGFLPPFMADEMLENHLLIESPGYYAGASLTETLQAVKAAGASPLTTWEDFAKANF